MTKIMVSYRRADAPDMAGRISDHLIGAYGEKSVFFDVNSIPTGVDYRNHIEKAIARSNIVVAVIGPGWLGRTAEGTARIQDPLDPVRTEIETALQRDLPILPLLVNGATMPEPAQLPDTLYKLHFCNAAKIDSGRDFRRHMSDLTQAINETLAISGTRSAKPAFSRFGRIPIYGAGGLALLVLLAVLLRTETWPFAQTAKATVTSADRAPIAPVLKSARAVANGGFIFPDSDRRYLQQDDLKDLSKTELRIARNEIFARRGRFFVDQSLAGYFAQFSWYHPNATDVVMSPLENTNVNTIKMAEDSR